MLATRMTKNRKIALTIVIVLAMLSSLTAVAFNASALIDDNTPPTVTRIDAASQVVDEGDTFNVYVYATDEYGLLEASRGLVYFYSADAGRGLLKELEPTDTPDKYVASFTVEEDWKVGEYKLDHITVTDANRNSTTISDYSNAELFPDVTIYVGVQPKDDKDRATPLELKVGTGETFERRYPNERMMGDNGGFLINITNSNPEVASVKVSGSYTSFTGSVLGYTINGNKEGTTYIRITKKSDNSEVLNLKVTVVPDPNQTTKKDDSSSSS